MSSVPSGGYATQSFLERVRQLAAHLRASPVDLI